jgi:lysophospholipase L1-like esterase
VSRRMRPLAIVALVLLALGASFVAISALTGDQGTRRAGSVTMLGDSLNLGMEPYLDDRLNGWTIQHDDVVGRTGDEGLAELQLRKAELAPVVVVSLGTNDSQTDAVAFRRLVEAVLSEAGPRRCVVWSTIWRNGPSDALNGVLREAADGHSNLEVADWAGLVEGNTELLARDGVHGTQEGYAKRAEQVAKIVERCLPASTSP